MRRYPRKKVNKLQTVLLDFIHLVIQLITDVETTTSKFLQSEFIFISCRD